jgi:predicted lipoprotein with Yx(FWY)xxD motif
MPVALASTFAVGTVIAAGATHSHPVVVKVHRGALGTMLVTAGGLTLYTLKGDDPASPKCTGGCASIWPPLLLRAGTTRATGGRGVHSLSAVRLPDGRYQVRYRGAPLYRFTGDKRPGTANGQGVAGLWTVAFTAGGRAPMSTANDTTTTARS